MLLPVSGLGQDPLKPSSHFQNTVSATMDRLLPDSSSANVAFRMPDLKHGMRCLPSFCLKARLLHECLTTGHFKCVSARPCGLDWINTQQKEKDTDATDECAADYTGF